MKQAAVLVVCLAALLSDCHMGSPSCGVRATRSVVHVWELSAQQRLLRVVLPVRCVLRR